MQNAASVVDVQTEVYDDAQNIGADSPRIDYPAVRLHHRLVEVEAIQVEREEEVQ